MTDNNQAKKPRNAYPDRFTIDPSNLHKIGSLIEQLKTAKDGIQITRKELVNWMIEQFPAQLRTGDVKDLSKRFYNEEQFLRAAWEEIRAAKTRGEILTLRDILARNKSSSAPAKRPRKSKEQASTHDPVAQNQNQSKS